MEQLWHVKHGSSAILATAIHDGHELRPEVAGLMVLDEASRLREEDPHTGAIACVADDWIVARRSRFEVDLNRPRATAVYRTPEDAWGLEMWSSEPPTDMVAESLATYDAFYSKLGNTLDGMVARWGKVVVLDVHSYNHRRSGPDAEPEDPAANPEVNVGTGSLDRESWGPIVDRFMADIGGFDYQGRHLDVRENVRFRGGHMSRWIHATYPDTCCCLAIEFKKVFMDEWTGTTDRGAHGALQKALAVTLPGLAEELAALG